MKILNFEELSKNLKEAKPSDSSDLLNEKNLDRIKGEIELNPIEEVGRGECLLNAFKIAQTTNAKIIEGVVYLEVEKDNETFATFIKHAWNSIHGKQFDFTKDYVWPNQNARVKKIEYLQAEEFSVNDYYIKNRILNFKSTVDLMSLSLKYLHTREAILLSLNSFGLNKKYQEHLLQELSESVKN